MKEYIKFCDKYTTVCINSWSLENLCNNNCDCTIISDCESNMIPCTYIFLNPLIMWFVICSYDYINFFIKTKENIDQLFTINSIIIDIIIFAKKNWNVKEI